MTSNCEWIVLSKWSPCGAVDAIAAAEATGRRPCIALEGDAVREYVEESMRQGWRATWKAMEEPESWMRSVCSFYGAPVYRLATDVMTVRLGRDATGNGCRR